MNNLHNFRKNYTKFQLDETRIHKSPFLQFDSWFKEAIEEGSFEANAMVLSTVNSLNRPSSRVVLLKQIVEEGFIFYTNYSSKKGKEIAQNKHASILFFWEKLERQIRVEGVVEKIPIEMSEDYFNCRPLASQISAVVSDQSEEIANREELEKKYKETEALKKIARPKNWGGYILKPNYFEFWQGRANRLHDRIIYKEEKNSWNTSRLSP